MNRGTQLACGQLSAILAGVALLLALLPVAVVADQPPATAEAADFREIWVPAEDLPQLLPTLGRSIAIGAREYRALRAEIGSKENADTPAPPHTAVLKSANFAGTLLPDASIATVRGEYLIESFSDGWSTIELSVDARFAGAIAVDGQSAVRTSGNKDGSDLLLLVRGKGEHQVSIDLHLPIAGQVGGNWIQLRSPGAPGSFALEIPAGLRLQSSLPFGMTAAGEIQTATFALPAERAANKIQWSTEDIAPLDGAAIFQTCRFIYSIDPTRIRGDLGVVLSSSLAELGDSASFELPVEVEVLSVEGTEVLGWQRDAATVTVNFATLPVLRREVDFRVIVEIPSLADGAAEAIIALPTLDTAGVHRTSGLFAVVSSDDVRVKHITTGSLVTQNYAEVDQDILSYPGFVGAFQFPALPDETQISIQRLSNRFATSIDTKIALQRESIYIEREISVLPTEGRLFETRIQIPQGEEMLGFDLPEPTAQAGPNAVDNPGANVAIEWQKDIATANTYVVRWRDSQPRPFVMRTRRDPDNWFKLGQVPVRLDFTTAKVLGSELTSGYLVADFDEAFRVLTAETSGLEERAEFQAMPGKLTWFRLDEFTLGLDVSKRSPEIESEIVGYLLPLANTLELEGQVNLDVKFSPIDKLAITLPPNQAEFLRFDSPLISERQLDAPTGTWTISFHQGLLGKNSLRFRMALPFTTSSSEGETRFTINAPVFTLPNAKRLRGTWIGEANTDTEVTFTTKGLDEIDSLRVPSIAGYQPRHRIIAAFNYRGDAHSMKIEGVRHQRAELVSTIVDDLRIDSLVARGGKGQVATDRHQITMAVRTSGDQFLEVGLPKGAQLWTLSVDGAAAKPVVSTHGTLRIQLPAFAEDNQAVLIKLIYETAGTEWKSNARRKLQPVRLAADIPVLHTKWHLHLPDGFSYDGFDSNLTKQTEQERLPLVAHALLETGSLQYHKLEAPVFEIVVETDHSVSPEHRETVQETDRLLRLAAGYFDIGRYDNAEKQHNKVLRIDPNNETARRGIEALELARQQYANTSRDHMRGKMLSQVDALWEAEVPSVSVPNGKNSATAAYVRNKLNTIIIPEIDFTEATIEEAIDFLRRQANELDPEGGGFGFIINANSNEDPFGGIGSELINLQLSNVSLGDVLKFTTELAGLNYKIDPNGKISINPSFSDGGQLLTETFKVPADFLTKKASEETESDDDPFAGGGTAGLKRRATAKDLLEQMGISFPDGSSASYIASTGEIVIRNTSSNMDLLAQALGTPKDAIGDASHVISPGGDFGGQGKVGILPLDFELPESGRTFVFEGFYAPDEIEFGYKTWERQIQIAWWWILAGSLGFLIVARRRPIFLGLIGGILLTFIPMLLPGLGIMPICNALLAGWTAAATLTIGLAIAARIARRIDQNQEGGASAHA